MTRQGDGGHIRSHTKTIRKILFTILTGGIGYYFTDLSDQPQSWSLAAGIFIGGVTMVVQFLNDFEHRIEKVEEKQEKHSIEMRSLIKEGFSRINEMAELFQAVETSALQTDTVIRLVRHAAQISPGSPQLVCELAQQQINRMAEFLKELSAGGVVEYEGEDQEWILGFTMHAKHTIDATSLSTVDAGGRNFHGGLWTSDLGRRYLKVQRQAMSRGVVIRRVFIIDRPGQASEPDFLNICQQHKNLGIKVRVLDRSNILDASTFESSLFDFIVFDSALSYETTSASMAIESSMKPPIIKTQLELKPDRVNERIQRFDDLWGSAKELE